jgi:hypothetical protein
VRKDNTLMTSGKAFALYESSRLKTEAGKKITQA